MKLLLYIRENKNKSIDLIQLSSKYQFELKDEKKGKKIISKKNPKYIEHFYGEKINDFSVIVGDNGVGKTTLIKSIAKKSESIYIQNRSDSNKDCLIYEDDKGDWSITNKFPSIVNLSSYPMTISEKKISEGFYFSRPKSNQFFYSPTLETISKKDFSLVIDCSTTNILNSNNNIKFHENSYTQLVRDDLKRQVRFVNDYEKEISSVLMTPKKIECEVNIEVDISESLMNFMEFEKRLISSNVFKNYIELWFKIKKEILCLENFEIKKGIDKFCQYQVETFFIKNLLLIFPIERVIHSESLPSINNRKLKELMVLYESLKKFFELELKNNRWENKLVTRNISDSDEYGKETPSSSEKVNEDELSVSTTIVLDFDDSFVKLFLTSFRKFYMEDLSKVLSFRWQGLSSGENSLLNLFSRFEMNDDKIEENVIIFIDEMDLGFHPKWQQSIIEILIKVFQKMFSDSLIQIILTTHSPLLLSNFRKNDVILMAKNDLGYGIVKENDISTFGTNLQKLLAHNFFLENALMGDFAKNKINDYFEIVIDHKRTELDYEDNLNYLKSIISEIGEPILRKRAIEEFTNYQKINLEKNYFSKELDLLRNEIEELKELKNNAEN
ncbi:AAA family ATPase [Vagococcus carniphilus]|uniref:AAA family ATPase n=1 Tax=Vagococcus carniphilus TaxID=218144 RepID=UPI003BA86F8E